MPYLFMVVTMAFLNAMTGGQKVSGRPKLIAVRLGKGGCEIEN
jgi:hypothetical protein